MKWNTNQIQIMSDDEIIALSEALKDELDLRKREKIDAAFNNMIQAIQEFRKLCPHATVFDYENSIPIVDVADRYSWDFGV